MIWNAKVGLVLKDFVQTLSEEEQIDRANFALEACSVSRKRLKPTAVSEKYGFDVEGQIKYKAINHSFTHFHLTIKPIHIKLQRDKNKVYDSEATAWINPKKYPKLGLPAPVLSMLTDLNNSKRAI